MSIGKYTTNAETLPREDKDFEKIREETYDECTQLSSRDAVEQEKVWADYLFKDGSIIGLNAELLKQYVEYIAGKRIVRWTKENSSNTGTNPYLDHGITGGETSQPRN